MSLGLEFTGSYDATQRNFNRLAAHTELTGTAHSIAVISALPVSPVEGQQVYFQDAAMAAAGMPPWHLRYTASAAKWQPLGASPLFAAVEADETTASGVFVALTTAGPSIAVPVAGVYMIEIGHTSRNSSLNSEQIMSYDIGGQGAIDADACWANAYTVSRRIAATRATQKTLAAVTLTAKYRTGGATANFQHRTMKLTPLLLG